MRMRPRPTATVIGDPLARRFADVRQAHDVPETFPPEVHAEAAAVAVASPHCPVDRTDVGFVTLDPPGARDLDQALAIERAGAGHRVRYAIADVGAFVATDGALDREARRRGVTIYCPDRRVPLYPPEVSEEAASLLPGRPRPAYVWDLRLDADGAVTDIGLERALVRSVARLDYPACQRALDRGDPSDVVRLLREVGLRRIVLESARGGASLPMPEQEVVEVPQDGYALITRPMTPVESWNAQISLMTGMAAARLMCDGGVGLLRTMPAPDGTVVERLRAKVRALGLTWPDDVPYGEFLRGLDRADSRHLAAIHEATSLFRGAGYRAFDGDVPEDAAHAAVGARYAHVTAPLRRLVDRFGLAVCHAIARGVPVPEPVRRALPELPEAMAGADRRAGAVERACIDAVEVAILERRRGSLLHATVLDADPGRPPLIRIEELAIVARAVGRADEGTHVAVSVAEADVASGRLELRIVEGA